MLEPEDLFWDDYIDEIADRVIEKLTRRQTVVIQKQEDEEVYVRGAKELAKLYNVSTTTIWRWVKEKNIPYIRQGGRHIFNKSEVDRIVYGYENNNN